MINTPLTPFAYHVPTEAVYGIGCFDTLGEHSRRLGTRPLLVTGKNSARRIGALDRALLQLEHASVYDAVEEDPGTDTCERGAALCRQLGCDHVIAIGGGSPIDVAKAIAGLAVNPGTCADHFGSKGLQAGALPVIAVPTTAGTGSEVTPYAVIVDSASRTKKTITGKAIFPRVALLDPELTRHLPRAATISTGLDVLSQSMEGIVSKKSTPVGDALALDACRRVRAYLPRAAAHGEDDLEARGQMLYASMLSGCVIAQSGTTLVHGMGYYYTLECGIPHGLANGLLLAPLFRHNARVAPEKVRTITEALLPHGTQGDVGPEEAVSRALRQLFGELGVSSAARDHGVSEVLLGGFAEDVASDPYRFRNQIGEISREAILRFYRESFWGIDVSEHK
ncbi:MAG: iron-containing alcohol dehydrogenase [Candidatus Hydrogenedentes bacterium]|nr:iron-containing alcohol dehydrogenase [Candidatus Hydrogenedentota bacterium]